LPLILTEGLEETADIYWIPGDPRKIRCCLPNAGWKLQYEPSYSSEWALIFQSKRILHKFEVKTNKQTNKLRVFLVRKRCIPTELPPLVGEF
jgi:hypothetical protein